MFVSLVRTVILYMLIIATVRIMGKRQIGELEPAELVAAILLSDLASVPMQDIGIPLLSGVVPILTILAMELLTAELTLKSVKFRKLFCGSPVFLICDGKLDQAAMAKNQLSLDELRECLRMNGILDISQVQYAVLETSGKLTTFLYPEFSPLTAKDAGKAPPPLEYPLPVVSDGRTLGDNLSRLGKDEGWLDRRLKQASLRREDVFLMTATPGGRVEIVRREARA